jgi:PncC family amidohydrolase
VRTVNRAGQRDAVVAEENFELMSAVKTKTKMKTKAKVSLAVELKTLLLREPRLTLAAAESLTAGNVQARIASVSGASGYFRGGVTAYSIAEKVKLLGVNRAAAKRVNCVSARVAEEMAVGAAKLFGADLAVATTGYAEPSAADGVAVPMASTKLPAEPLSPKARK